MRGNFLLLNVNYAVRKEENICGILLFTLEY